MSGKLATRLIHTRGARLRPATVNPPLERASTVLLPSVAALYGEKPAYGRMGLTVHRELEAGLATLEEARHVRLAPSGLAACTLALISVLDAGDHLLFSDAIYGPTRRFCERTLKRFSITAEAFPPGIGAGLEERIRPETRAILLESPGSLTFEISDTEAIVALARARGLTTLADNTWSAGVYHKPLALGVDVSIQALTKYVVGHSDAFAGAVMAADDEIGGRVAEAAEAFGIGLGPEEAYQALRGLRTLPTRLAAHEAAALDLAERLAGHPAVERVIHPARADHPDHALWVRDFTGSSGLFAIELKPVARADLNAALESLAVFGMGFSWGGYESLVIPCDPQLRRSPGDWTGDKAGPLLRLHVGLEAVDDLAGDILGALGRLAG